MFDVQAAGIEADALAHQRDLRTATAPSEIDETRCPAAGAADDMNCRVVSLEKLLAGGDGTLGSETLGQIAGGGCEFCRPHVFGRRVDKIAHERNCRGFPLYGCQVLGSRHQEPGHHSVFLAIASEAVTAESPGQGGPACLRRAQALQPVGTGRTAA